MSADVPIRPASTVVVLRDTPAGPEVFLVRRHHAIAFMAGAHVFPGGRVDGAYEGADHAWCSLPSPAVEARGPSLAFAVAALRELFEEAGVLLARTPDGSFVALDAPAERHRFEAHREAVHDGRRSFREVIEAEGLRLAVDAVVPFAHWLTPPIEIRRFDTWFFAARLPDRQHPVHDPYESTDSGWMTPSRALAQTVGGAINLPPPTWATLREIERFSSADAVIAWATTRSIVERQPIVVEDEAVRAILLPGDPGHPTAEQVAFETRFVWSNGRWLPEPFAP